jgi:hypothetical protein
MGVIVGPGIVKRQDHPTGAGLPGREHGTDVIEMHNGELLVALAQDFHLAGKDPRRQGQTSALGIDPVPSEYSDGRSGRQRPTGLKPNR